MGPINCSSLMNVIKEVIPYRSQLLEEMDVQSLTVCLDCRVTSHSNLPRTERVARMWNFQCWNWENLGSLAPLVTLM